MTQNDANVPPDPFARRRELDRRLADAPEVELFGVVAPSGVSGGKSRGEDAWTMSVRLAVWRARTGPLQERDLVLQRLVTDAELKQFQSQIAPYDVYRARGRLVDDPAYGRAYAQVAELAKVAAPDVGLTAAATRLRQPVTYEDPVLGVLTLDRSVNLYCGRATWGGIEVRVDLPAAEGGGPPRGVDVAHAQWRDHADWGRRAVDRAVTDLLPIKNDAWLGDDEAELSPAAFAARLRLDNISVESDGSLSFWFDDGDLFWGHVVCVSGTLVDGPTDAQFMG